MHCHPQVPANCLGVSNRRPSVTAAGPRTFLAADGSLLNDVVTLERTYTLCVSVLVRFSYLNRVDWSGLASHPALFCPKPQLHLFLPSGKTLDLWLQRPQGVDGLSSRNVRSVAGSPIFPHPRSSEITSPSWMTLVSTSKCTVTSSSIL